MSLSEGGLQAYPEQFPSAMKGLAEPLGGASFHIVLELCGIFRHMANQENGYTVPT